MQVSPFTQYFLRKLLRNYLTQTRSLSTYIRVAAADTANISQILDRPTTDPRTTDIRNYKLETLIEAYSKLETRGDSRREELQALEQEILNMLGLRLGRILPTLMPKLIAASQIQQFRFCLGIGVYDGMCHGGHFFGLVQQHHRLSSIESYQLAWALGQKEIPCVITRSTQSYQVWVDLRCQSAIVLLEKGATIVPPVLTLYPKICRYRANLAVA
jgi:hypothetical protein